MTYFDRHYFKESIRQTRGLAIVYIAAAVFSAGFLPVVRLFQHVGEKETAIELVGVSEYSHALPYICAAVPVFFTLKLFGFLFKRGSSDFYHALPFKRECIYLTNLAAMIMWYVIGLLVALFSVTLCYAIDPVVIFKGELIWYNFKTLFIMMLFITGAMLIAASAVGKRGIALTVGLMVILLPRALIALTISAIDDRVYLLEQSGIFFFSSKYNLPYTLLLGQMMNPGDYAKAFTFVPGQIISLIISLVYIAIGCILFTKRRSETAENAAPNKKADAVLQLSYSMVFFILAVAARFEQSELYFSMTFIVIGLIVFIVYEMLAYRSAKELVRSLPRLGIAAALCLVYFIFLTITSSNILKKSVSGDEIMSVKPYYPTDMYSWYYSEQSYSQMLQSEIEFTDQEIKNLIASSYAYTIDMAKNQEGFNPWSGDYYSQTFKICYNDGSSSVRELYMKAEDKEKLEKLMKENEEYIRAKTLIPEDAYVNIFSEKEHNDRLWECFKQEYAGLSGEQKQKVAVIDSSYFYYHQTEDSLNEEEENADTDSCGISLYGYYGAEIFRQSYSFGNSIMPKTVALYRELQHEENLQAFRSFEDYIRNGAPVEGDSYTELIGFDDGVYDYDEVSINFYHDGKGGLSVSIYIEYSPIGSAYGDDYHREIVDVDLDGEEARAFGIAYVEALNYEKLPDAASPDTVITSCSFYSWSGFLHSHDFSGDLWVQADGEAMKSIFAELLKK